MDLPFKIFSNSIIKPISGLLAACTPPTAHGSEAWQLGIMDSSNEHGIDRDRIVFFIVITPLQFQLYQIQDECRTFYIDFWYEVSAANQTIIKYNWSHAKQSAHHNIFQA